MYTLYIVQSLQEVDEVYMDRRYSTPEVWEDTSQLGTLSCEKWSCQNLPARPVLAAKIGPRTNYVCQDWSPWKMFGS